MSVSLPSKEIFNLDVPEVKQFTGKFVYNFFTRDEKINDAGQIPESEFKLNANSLDDSSIKLFTVKTPRYVQFKIKPTKLVAFNLKQNELNSIEKQKSRPSITKNFDKIISEDDFSSNSFVSVNFNDGTIEDKIHDVISGSLVGLSLNNDVDTSTTQNKLMKQVNSLVSDADINIEFLSRYFGGLDKKLIKFFSSVEGKDRIRKMATINGQSDSTNNKIQIENIIHDDVHNVNFHVQINSKILNDVVKKQVVDPLSLFSGDLIEMQDFAKKTQENAKKNVLPTDSEYRSIVPFIDVKVQNTAFLSDNSTVETIGFIIDKIEVKNTGEQIFCDPIIIESPNTTFAIDTRVKYGSRYRYQIRTINLFSLPAIDNESGDLGIIRTLVSSKPSKPIYVLCNEEIAPPPPVDIEFVWNFEINKLSINWSHPVNTQRDIKYFQIFRRSKLDEAFELIKVFDFDDSVIVTKQSEKMDSKLVEKIQNSKTFWIDDEFTKNSRYIYSIVSLDAHGFSSGYSAQFEIWFDRFKNRLQKTLISHSGAPKPYPNMYVSNNLFIDSIKNSNSKRMKLVFNPEFYEAVNNDGNVTKVVSTLQDGCEYQINVLNVDNQKSDVVTITIDDRRSADTPINTDQFVIGQTKK